MEKMKCQLSKHHPKSMKTFISQYGTRKVVYHGGKIVTGK